MGNDTVTDSNSTVTDDTVTDSTVDGDAPGGGVERGGEGATVNGAAAEGVELKMSVVPESWMRPEERWVLGDMLPEQWREQYPGSAARGWTRREPAWRLLVTCGDQAVAQAALVVLTPSLLALTDAVVVPQWRGAGLGAALVDTSVWFCDHHGVALAMSTGAPTLVAAMAGHGARVPQPDEMALAGSTVPAQWLVRPGRTQVRGVELALDL